MPIILAVIACCIVVFYGFKPNYYSEADLLDFLTDIKYATLSKVNLTKTYYFSAKIVVANGSIIVSKPVIQFYFAETNNVIKAPIMVSRNMTLVGLVKLKIISLDNFVYIEVVDKE